MDYKQTPLWNKKLPIDERLDYLIAELTLEEKLICLTTASPEVPRLGLVISRLGGEAAHGVVARHDQGHETAPPVKTTSFPQPIGMSGSFDRDLIRACGKVVGIEARAVNKKVPDRGLSRWAPTVDMERDPRWGRTEEGYGEDPCLTGEMASAYVRGMRGDDPEYILSAATLKHFYANNTEKDRATYSASIDGRNKHEYYLEPFRKCVVEGGADALMTAYNEINGVPGLLNDEVLKLAKEEWGLTHAVCDGGDFLQTVEDHKFFVSHAETCAASLKAGIDSFPDKPDAVIEAGREALERGLMTMEDLDRSVRNTFATRLRLGLCDPAEECPYAQIGEESLCCEEHKDISMQMAKEAVVLLKNEDRLLPIKASRGEEMEPLQIAVLGPLADVWYKDWYGGLPPYTVTPLAGIRAEYPDATINYHNGLNEVKILCGGRYIGLDGEARLYMTSADKAETFTVNDWGSQSLTLQAKSNGLFVTVDSETGAMSATKAEIFAWDVREVWKLEDIVETSISRKMSRSAGMVNFHLRSWDDKPIIIDDEGYLCVITDGSEPESQLSFSKILIADGLKEAVDMAFGADYVFVFVGSNPVINAKETIDRDTLALPPNQYALAERVRAVNQNTVMVIVSNYPYTLGDLADSVSSIIFSATGSQDLGSAIAQTISGRSNPAARLTMTWYADEAQLPDISDYDIIKGKRTYQYFEKDVLYPFGHGLSYSRFTYGGFAVTLDMDGKKADISLTLRNSGYYGADEVVQIYVSKEGSRVKRPLRQLKAFARIKDMKPGERRDVNLSVALDDLRFYDVISERMVLEDGGYVFEVGASSKDIRGQVALDIPGETIAPRDPFTYTKATAYDDYRNIILHRGPQKADGGYLTCVTPQASPEAAGRYSSCKLIFDDFVFSTAPAKLRLSVKATEVCKMVLLAGTAMIASEDFGPADEYASHEIAVNPDKVPLDKKVPVQIQIYGHMGILGFEFLP